MPFFIANAANIPASDMDKIFTAVAESDVKFANEVFASDNDILADVWYNSSDRSKIKETGKWVLFHPRKGK